LAFKQVSFFSTSPELSNKQRFEYFSRTIPSDHYQVKAMVEIVKLLGWSYISIIYEESNYGVKAFEELEELLAEHNICIAVKEKLVKDSGVAQERAYDTIVQRLLTKSRARGECSKHHILAFICNNSLSQKRQNFDPKPLTLSTVVLKCENVEIPQNYLTFSLTDRTNYTKAFMRMESESLKAFVKIIKIRSSLPILTTFVTISISTS
jgi:hypothetical protein